MKINGYQIREAIKRWRLQRDLASSQFDSSLYSFESEAGNTLSPEQVMKDFEAADRAIARLEEVQQRYNQTVRCDVQREEVTLALAVKLVGGAGRREKMWRSASTPKRDRYAYRDETRSRNKDTEYAQRTMSQEDCVTLSKASSRYASALRNAIARANNSEVDIEAVRLEEAEAKRLFDESV